MGPPGAFEPDSEDEDESLTVPLPPEDDSVSAYSCLMFWFATDNSPGRPDGRL
jgi:hypothetical protein